jgi:hypothetical protein
MDASLVHNGFGIFSGTKKSYRPQNKVDPIYKLVLL